MRWLLVALILAGTLGAATADTAGTQEEQAACRPDVRKFCGKIGKGDNQKYRDCLRTHVSELSPKCRQVLMNHQGAQ